MKVKNYILLQEIGSGSFATVYKAADANDQTQVYAIKSIRSIPKQEREKMYIRNQIELIKEIKHKNVVNYVDDFIEKGKWYIVLEYCGKGDLENYFKKQGKLPQRFCKNLASSMISALDLLHKKGIAHRDLKIANILINDDYDFKIADFGMAKAQENGIMETCCGSPFAMAPEILNNELYNTKCDTWALGVMLYQLIYGILPFDVRKDGGGRFGLKRAVLDTQPDYDIPSVKISDEGKDFIKSCLKKNPQKRPTMKILSRHQWLNVGIDSTFRRDYLKASFEKDFLMKKRTKQILNKATQDHIQKLVQNYRLKKAQIATFLATIEKYYKQNLQIRAAMLLMNQKIFKQLCSQTIIIKIEERRFEIKLMNVNNFKYHIEDFNSFIVSQLNKCTNESIKNIERQIIKFYIQEGKSCLNITQNLPDKINLLNYLSKLPINSPKNSAIILRQSFNETQIIYQQILYQILQKLNEQQIEGYINDFQSAQQTENNWIVEHEFGKTKREGPEIELGEFISRVIGINSSFFQ